MSLSSRDLRRAFLDYFAQAGHEVVAGSSLVPANDPTLLFTNAGMVQFKDVFLGRESRATRRATTAQRCVRAGGKHNDLENVGYTARHHTFFEMMGNFSFGDYFKREAIHFAWGFVTEVLQLPPERLWCTVYKDDDESARIWVDEIGIDPKRLSRLGEKDNFWSMGETGPCGPCSEIFYDHGPEVAGGPPGSPDEDGDRYVEFWNLVFMQFNRDAEGNMTPLPKPSVDTGLGLERTAAIMQGVHSNYEIDLFVNLIAAAAAATGTSDLKNNSLRVIADHIRSCSFLIADGVLPSNEGRGYVLRRIIRRAVRHGYMLGQHKPFFHTLVDAVDREMGDAYPELTRKKAEVERVLHQEEDRFAETLTQGMRLLDEQISGLKAGGVIPGDTVFKLYDTFGFPEDLTADIARERGLSVDQAGFDRCMAEQRTRAREASRFGVSTSVPVAGSAHLDTPTEFLGYTEHEADATALALFNTEGQPVDVLRDGETGTVVLDRTPFYAEGGGQMGDTGVLQVRPAGAASAVRFDVRDTRKLGTAFGHIGTVAGGDIATGSEVHASIDAERRAAIVLNHSATHLLHAALRRTLGEHVQQKGSLVAPDHLRFDFAHGEPVRADEIERIEELVNAEVRHNDAADVRVMAYDEAIGAGALAFFGDKYGDRVRVLKLGDFSTELCGGTHVKRTGDIGLFKIVSESGVAAGVRRIEAVTGAGALEWVNAGDRTLRDVATLVRGQRSDVGDKVSQLVGHSRQLEREIDTLKSRLATGGARDLVAEAEEVGGVRVVVARLEATDAKALRSAVDQLKDKLGSGIVVLATVEDDKVRLAVGVTRDLTERFQAGALIRPVAEAVNGRGGGRPDFAQAGGTAPEHLDAALALVKPLVAAGDGA